ncbi:MAG: MarR family transcriptional regulator [Clostridiales bacterium]|nr:MarR family transcriptional regulator [Clostridiales bacterium]
MEKTVPFTRTIHKIIFAAKEHYRVIEEKTSDFGMHRSMYMTLLKLSKRDVCPCQRELAKELGISAAAMATTVERLEDEGYIEKRPSESDKRTNIISITQKGRDAFEKSNAIFERVDGKMLDGFDEDEIAALSGYLDRICDNLSKMKGDAQNDGN